LHDLLDWTEKAAQENLKFHLQNADSLAKEANTTLTVLLAALGGVLAYALKLLDSGLISATLVSVAVLTLYLTALCSLLVFKCMKIAPIPAPTNEPKNLYQKDLALDRLREVELDNIQSRIDQAVARNDGTTAWLNRVRVLAVLSPVIFAVALVCTAQAGLDLSAQAVVVGSRAALQK